MIRKVPIVVGIAAIHFVVAKIIVALTMQMGMFAAGNSRAAGFLGNILVGVTRLLYFPVITLSLYSRNWFPGDWIYVPFAVNSLLWGIAIYGLIRLMKRFRSR
ncbi:MAG: hypothetical protein ABF292_13975 [Desulfobacterales bacterium]